jgi:ATP-dependent helicase HepA
MQNIQIGQRWLVDTDASLGLGLIIECEGRFLTLEFPATGETRRYARQNAPLTRAIFDAGDAISTVDGQEHTVSRVENINDLLIYLNQDGDPIPESQLAPTIQLNHPLKRLLAAQLDKPNWFDVREQLSRDYQTWLASDVIGLMGARINLNPHQLYVAYSATSRHPVRVLLADEVGLGKTIEAGLILQRLQRQNFVSRALVLVPEALCVQWFVELLRSFSIHCALVDKDTESSELNDSRVFIASHQSLEERNYAEVDPWDMVMVDEAHHFDLVTENAGGDQLKALGDHTTHLLLLSATPERLGLESHFSRLQLLDKNKFFDFDEFQSSYQRYQSLADKLPSLMTGAANEIVSEEKLNELQELFPINLESGMTNASVMEILLDIFGTGRMVYRNTRHAVAGFPERKLVRHNIDGEEEKRNWLLGFVKQYKNEKLLLITHDKEEVLELREWLYRKTGIDCPVFHEDMTLVERDRAAAYFADAEDGAPLLLCSEIGSEGRNFQFCHRLVCWDLPEHPDVLEQRIGRLDRIGQTNDIEIHICIESESAGQRLYWFHDILSSIEKINPAAGAVHDRWFEKYCQNPDAVENEVKQELNTLLEELEQGRDKLLELNSCRLPEAEHLIEQIEKETQDNNPKELIESIADVLNLHYEQLDEHSFRLVPSDQMLIPMIPGIPLEGCAVTFDRATAIAREDIEFVTWDHPLMQGLSEIINTSDLGVASVGLLPNKNLKQGMLFAEILFNLSVQSSESKMAERYLTQSGVRVVVTANNAKNLANALPSEQLSWIVEPATKPVRHAVIKDYREQISYLAETAEKIALSESENIINESLKDLQERSSLEINRLQQLQQKNDQINEGDIQVVSDQFDSIKSALKENTTPIFSAIRLLITYKPN